jgi:hypothetical protein
MIKNAIQVFHNEPLQNGIWTLEHLENLFCLNGNLIFWFPDGSFENCFFYNS